MKVLQPPSWPRPKGYSNGISVRGRLIVTGGTVGWDETERFVSDSLASQFEQALRNVLAILAETRPRMLASAVDGKQDRFKVIFGKAGRPCPRCGAEGVVSLIRVRGQGDDNRRTFWCETCQH